MGVGGTKQGLYPNPKPTFDDALQHEHLLGRSRAHKLVQVLRKAALLSPVSTPRSEMATANLLAAALVVVCNPGADQKQTG